MEWSRLQSAALARAVRAMLQGELHLAGVLIREFPKIRGPSTDIKNTRNLTIRIPK